MRRTHHHAQLGHICAEVVDILQSKIIQPPLESHRPRITSAETIDDDSDEDGVIELRPSGDDLNTDGIVQMKISDGYRAKFGFCIKSASDRPLYAWIFMFNMSDLSISRSLLCNFSITADMSVQIYRRSL